MQPEDAHVLEVEDDAASRAETAASVVEERAHVGDGARRVVCGCLDEHSDSVGSVPLVKDLLVDRRALTGGALDRGLDLVLGHVHGAVVLEDATERRVVLRDRPTGLHRDRDVLPDAGELFGHPVPAAKHRRLPGLENPSHPSPSMKLSATKSKLSEAAIESLDEVAQGGVRDRAARVRFGASTRANCQRTLPPDLNLETHPCKYRHPALSYTLPSSAPESMGIDSMRRWLRWRSSLCSWGLRRGSSCKPPATYQRLGRSCCCTSWCSARGWCSSSFRPR